MVISFHFFSFPITMSFLFDSKFTTPQLCKKVQWIIYKYGWLLSAIVYLATQWRSLPCYACNFNLGQSARGLLMSPTPVDITQTIFLKLHRLQWTQETLNSVGWCVQFCTSHVPFDIFLFYLHFKCVVSPNRVYWIFLYEWLKWNL